MNKTVDRIVALLIVVPLLVVLVIYFNEVVDFGFASVSLFR